MFSFLTIIQVEDEHHIENSKVGRPQSPILCSVQESKWNLYWLHKMNPTTSTSNWLYYLTALIVRKLFLTFSLNLSFFNLVLLFFCSSLHHSAWPPVCHLSMLTEIINYLLFYRLVHSEQKKSGGKFCQDQFSKWLRWSEIYLKNYPVHTDCTNAKLVQPSLISYSCVI